MQRRPKASEGISAYHFYALIAANSDSRFCLTHLLTMVFFGFGIRGSLYQGIDGREPVRFLTN